MTDNGSFLTAWESRPIAIWQTRWRVPELLMFERVGSTNDIIKARADQGAEAGALAIAEFQTRGRGRRDSQWRAPSGTGLLMSMLFRPASSSRADLAGTIPIRVGIAAARAVERVTGIDVALKWPNDIVARDGRKLAGILCESSLSSTGIAYTVVGIGLNVLQTEQQLHDDARNRAVSLRLLADAVPDRGAVATALIEALLALAPQAARALSPDELAEYAARDVLARHEVTADGTAAGVASGIGDLGDLRVRQGRTVRSIHAGTVRRAL
ncbi:MAG: biotin--[acetyl-CoA-carboxylase] ligase [Longimicrobiales bacterium]